MCTEWKAGKAETLDAKFGETFSRRELLLGFAAGCQLAFYHGNKSCGKVLPSHGLAERAVR